MKQIYRGPGLVERVRALRSQGVQTVSPAALDPSLTYSFTVVDAMVEQQTSDATLCLNLQSESDYALPHDQGTQGRDGAAPVGAQTRRGRSGVGGDGDSGKAPGRQREPLAGGKR